MPKKEYIVKGECLIGRTYIRKSVVTIRQNNIIDFWEKYEKLKNKRGIYIFATRAGKGYTPYYVGKASKKFVQEIFNPHKLLKYNNVILNKKGKPVFFFIIQQGHKNEYVNKKVEIFLTALCYKKNKNIENIQNKKEDKWYIRGVVNTEGKRFTTPAESKLRKCLGI